MAEFDSKNCPMGLVHEKEIEHTRNLLNMAIQRIEEKIETVTKDVNEGFAEVSTHFDAVDKRFDALEKKVSQLKEDLRDTIDSRIKQNNGAKALNFIKWVVITVGGSIVITIMTKLALQVFKLS